MSTNRRISWTCSLHDDLEIIVKGTRGHKWKYVCLYVYDRENNVNGFEIQKTRKVLERAKIPLKEGFPLTHEHRKYKLYVKNNLEYYMFGVIQRNETFEDEYYNEQLFGIQFKLANRWFQIIEDVVPARDPFEAYIELGKIYDLRCWTKKKRRLPLVKPNCECIEE